MNGQVSLWNLTILQIISNPWITKRGCGFDGLKEKRGTVFVYEMHDSEF